MSIQCHLPKCASTKSKNCCRLGKIAGKYRKLSNIIIKHPSSFSRCHHKMLLKPQQKLMECPFDPQHLVTEDRFQRHVIYCMKKYPKHLKCPYNATHCFFSNETLTQHICECPNKVLSQPWKYINSSNVNSNINNAAVHIEVNCSDESWEHEY